MSNFERALAITLRYEGGNVDDPTDRGGRTSRGITQRTYDGMRQPDWPVDVWDATDDQVRSIYQRRFWERIRGDELPWPLCLVAFDTAVLHGVTFAISRLQSVVGVTVDGKFGPKTLEALLRFNPYGVTEAFLQRRDDRYEELITRDVTQKKFYGGWEERCDQLCDAAGVPRTIDREEAA